jgi:transposase
LRRAAEEDPVAVERWKSTEYPVIRALAREGGAAIFFGDEASVRSDYHSGTTWAPLGETPIVPATGKRFKVNMVSAVSPTGSFSFDLFEGSMNADRFVEFCEKLARDNLGRPVFLIVDNVKYHKSRVVKEYVESTNGMFRLFFLPPYSPELNPDEWVWKNVKHDRIGKLGSAAVSAKADLWTRTLQALNRLAGMPELIRGFFADANLSYIMDGPEA